MDDVSENRGQGVTSPHQKPPLTQTNALHQWNQSRRSPHVTQHNTEKEEDGHVDIKTTKKNQLH